MKKGLVLLILVYLLADSNFMYGQADFDSLKVYKIETKDGNIFIGSVIGKDQNTIYLNTESLGRIRLLRSDIRSSTELKDYDSGKDGWLPNPQSSRYFWSPNGYGLEQGSAYYQNIWVFYNQVSLGVTDNFSIGAGMLPLFLFAGAPTPVWLVPKLSFPVVENKFNIGTGAFLATVLGEETGLFGLLYGTTTFGSRDKNFSLGMAYGFAGEDWMDIPLINASTMIRTGPRGYFISENYIFSAEGATAVMVSLGGRSIIRNIGLDYSLWLPFFPEMDSFVAIPFIGITIPLGKRRVL